MPQTPPASANQKALLEQLRDLSQTDATNSGNQITLLNDQLARYQDNLNLMQSRYDYWDKFATDYLTERKYLDGNGQLSPLTITDFNNFLAQSGRLWNAALPLPARLNPIRIAEFDGSGTTYVATDDEAAIMTREAAARLDLTSGFVSPTFPLSFDTTSVLTPASTTLNVSRNSSATFPTGVRFVVQGSFNGAICLCTGSTLISGAGPFIYQLGIQVLTASFVSIPANANVDNLLLAFTDAERLSKTASQIRRQPILDGLISNYSAIVTEWKTNLQNQRNAIVNNTAEDAPDATYIVNQLAALNQLIAYFPAVVVGNAALATVGVLNTTRTASRPTRVAYINSRLLAVLAYDERYKYAGRLYNLSDGAYTSISVLTRQRDSLVASQAASNQRAADISSEIF